MQGNAVGCHVPINERRSYDSVRTHLEKGEQQDDEGDETEADYGERGEEAEGEDENQKEGEGEDT